jgi:malonyl-CoA/methylmalonyl-CoA synthetase
VTNLAKVLSDNAAQYAGKPAIIFEGQSYTFREVDTSVTSYAALLQRLGVKKGDRVALQLPKCMEFIFLHLANLSLGAVTLPLNTAYTPEETAYFLSDSGSSLIFTDSPGFERVRNVLEEMEKIKTVLIDDESPDYLGPLSKELDKTTAKDFRNYPTHADDVAIICYTSGTTGKPKGAMITHRNLVTNMTALKEVWQWTQRDVLLHVLPLFHMHGLAVALHGSLNAGSTIIMHEKFDPQRTWKAIERNNCSMLMAVPTIYHRMINEWDAIKPDLSSMRVFISGSAPLPENVFYRFENTTGFRILERYGMTEAQMISSNPYDLERRIPKSVGYPLPGIQIRLVSQSGEDVVPGEVGEVWIKGDNIFKGYWQMPDKTKDSFVEGWFRSGDLGYQDPEDQMRLYLVGRRKELIISGGYNVYSKEVENVLDQHEAVQESAVIGIPDEDFGEKVTAVVVLKKDQPEAPPEELIAFCKKRLASYKCPKQVFFIDELPRNAMGKIQKNILQKNLSKESLLRRCPRF